MKKYFAIAAVAIVLLGCGKSASISDDDSKRLNDNANPTAKSTKAAPVADSQIVAGDWEVGKKDDIASGIISPGTYVITALSSGNNCYYATVKNFDGDLDSIITNGNIDPGTNARVVVKSTYAGLSLKGDCLAKRKP